MDGPKRQYPRYSHEATVLFRFGSQVIVGRTVNLSRGGLCANVLDQIPIGSDVEVDISMVLEDKSESEILQVSARVVWCTRFESTFQLGVSFRNLDNERVGVLTTFLHHLGD